MKILFVDDDPENVEGVAAILKDALDLPIQVVGTVEEAVAVLQTGEIELLVTDIFIPMGPPQGALGPRARKKAEDIEHLGGLVLLDELDRLPECRLLVHTACVDRALLEVLGERSVERVRKPAPPEVLLEAILRILREH